MPRCPDARCQDRHQILTHWLGDLGHSALRAWPLASLPGRVSVSHLGHLCDGELITFGGILTTDPPAHQTLVWRPCPSGVLKNKFRYLSHSTMPCQPCPGRPASPVPSGCHRPQTPTTQTGPLQLDKAAPEREAFRVSAVQAFVWSLSPVPGREALNLWNFRNQGVSALHGEPLGSHLCLC